MRSSERGDFLKSLIIIRLKELLNHKIIFNEHIICAFPENIISRFDVSVNDVAKEFAKMLQSKIKDSILKYYIAKQKKCDIL